MFSCLQILEAGLTPSQLYVFMPPNLGGFFMVRSYYPSECHADYFDFERIEALKPARSEERFSRNAETDLVCRLLLEKKKNEYENNGCSKSQQQCDSNVI